MLLPRFTIRRVFLLTALAGLGFAVAAAAVQGQVWATATSIALLSLIVAFMLYAMFFFLGSLLAFLSSATQHSKRGSTPFAGERLPPQLVPPRQPEND